MTATEREYRTCGGFTVVELLIGLIVTVVALLAISNVLACDQQVWLGVYNRVYGDVPAESDAARRRFDALVRKASKADTLVDPGGAWMEVCYCSNEAVPAVDRYARLSVSDGNLNAEYGSLNPRATETTEVLCGHVVSCLFQQIGDSVRMVLTLDDGSHNITVTTSAVMHVR